MMGFLDRVILEKEREVARKKERLSRTDLETAVCKREARSFVEALAERGGIIAEIKKRSPSCSVFRQNGSPARLAKIYEDNGASALSIVTDGKNFGTSLADVGTVRRACGLPVLVKDFIIDDYQVLEAAAAGADAVLLIARILSARTLKVFAGLARRLGVSALVECHDRDEVAKAIASGAEMIGINNRDLDCMEVSLDSFRGLAHRVPDDRLCIAESGIRSREDVEELLGLGADAFLVGTALLNSEDPGRKLRELLGRGEEGGAS